MNAMKVWRRLIICCGLSACSLVSQPPSETVTVQRAALAPTCPAVDGGLLDHPDNPRYFVDRLTQQPVIISSYKNIVPEDPSIPEERLGDQVDDMVGYQLTYARVWHLLPWNRDENQYPNALWPWAKRKGTLNCWGDPLYELSACQNPNGCADFNGMKILYGRIEKPGLSYWPRLTKAIRHASDYGITSEVMLFDSGGMTDHDTDPNDHNIQRPFWHNNPWATGNNVNFTSLPSCDRSPGAPTFYNPTDDVRNAQDAYVRTLIDHTVDDNVIFEIENEHGEDDYRWGAYWAAFVKNHIESNKKPARLVSYNSTSRGDWQYDPSKPKTDLDAAYDDENVNVVNLHIGGGSNGEGNFPAILFNVNTYITSRWSKHKAINVDEFGNGEKIPDHLRKLAWTIIASGGHFHIEDAAPESVPQAISVAQNVQAFIRDSGWNFVMSAPQTNLSNEPFCMAPVSGDIKGTADYLCYYTQGDYSSTGVRLRDLPVGQYHVRWWNPRNRGFARDETFDYVFSHSGGDVTTRPSPRSATPNENDWILFVRKVPPSETASFHPLTPCRAVDTRGLCGSYGGPALTVRSERIFPLGGQCGVPQSARAVMVNLTVTQPAMPGYLTAYAAGRGIPPTSSLNFGAQETRANTAIVDRNMAIHSEIAPGATAHAIVDVIGYFE
jgi:hypothetical protein